MPEPPPASPGDLHRALIRFIDVLEAHDTPYMIVGAIAVAVWGRPRTTADVDVTIRADAAALDTLTERARASGFAADDRWLEWNPLLRGSQVRLLSSDIVIDAMRPRDQHEEAALDRRRPVQFEGRALWVAAPDDLILMKLKAGRPRDFEDAIGILAAQGGALDEAYLMSWARRLGVMDELAYLLGEER